MQHYPASPEAPVRVYVTVQEINILVVIAQEIYWLICKIFVGMSMSIWLS